MAVDPQRFLAAALGGDASPSSPPPPVSSGGGYAVDPQSFLQAALAPDPEAEARARQPFLPPPIPGVAEGIEAELQFGNGTRTQPTVLEQLGGVGRAVVTGGQQLLGGLGTALETAGQGMQQPGITGGALAGVPLEAIGQVLSQGAEQYQANAYPAEVERQAMAEQSPLWGYAQDVAAQVPQILAATATGGGAPALAVLGASAAGQGIQQAEAEGATPGEAVAYGTASGVIEAATERIGTIPLVDKILKRAITGPVVKGGALKRVLADIGKNFGEEFAASVGNEIAAVATYQEGISPDALQKAVYSGLVGAGLGGGVSAMAEVANRGAAPEPPPPVLPTEAPVEAPQAAPPVVEAPVAQEAPPPTPEPIRVPQVEPLPPQPEVVPQAPPVAVEQAPKPTRKRKAGPSPEELAQLQAEAAPVEQAPAEQEAPKPREQSILVADFGGRRLSDVYKNPTQSDINAIRKLNRFEHSDRNSMSEPQFRSLLDAEGNVYVWSSFEGSHEQAKKELESRGVEFVGDGLARVGSTYKEVYPDPEYLALFTKQAPAQPVAPQAAPPVQTVVSQEDQNAEAAQADVAEAGRPAPTQTPVAPEAGRPAPTAVLEETPDALRRKEGRQEGREAVAETPAQPVAEPTPSPAPAEPIAIESTPESGRAGTPRIEAYTERPSIDPMTGEEGTYRTEYRIRKPTVEDREKSKYPLGNYLLERRSIRRGEDLGWELLDEGKSREYLFDYISADATPVSEGFRKSAEARLAQRVKDAEEKERKEAEEAAAEVRRAAKKRGDDAFVRMQQDAKYEGILKEWVTVHDAVKAAGKDFLDSLKNDAGFMELYNRALDEHRLPQKSKAYREVIANLKTRLEIARGEKNLKKAIPSRKGSGIVAGAAPEEVKGMASTSSVPYMKMPVNLTAPPAAPSEPLGTQGVLAGLNRIWDVPIRFRHFRKKAQAIFKTRPEVVRMKDAGDLPASAHEIAHYIDKTRPGLIQGAHKAATTELITLGKRLYSTGQHTLDFYKSEGFAEYVRHRLTRDDAAQEAPEFDLYFNGAVAGDAELSSKLAQSKGLYDQWRGQAPIQRAKGQIDFDQKLGKMPVAEKVREIGRKTIDYHIDSWAPVDRYTKAILEKSGKTRESLLPKQDPYQLLVAFQGSEASVARQMMLKGVRDAEGSIIADSIQKAMSGIKAKDWRDFFAYALAKRTIELEPKGKQTGLDIDDAKAIVAQHESPEWIAAAKSLNSYANGLVDILQESGALTAEQATKIKESEWYIPLTRVWEVESGGRLAQDYPGKKKQAAGTGTSPIEKMSKEGSQRPIQDPMLSLAQLTERVVNASLKARVFRAVYALQEGVEGVGDIIEEVDAPKVPQTFTLERIQKQLEDLGIDVPSTVDAESLLTIFTNSAFPVGADPIVSGVVDGKRKFLYVKDPMLYNSLANLPPPWLEATKMLWPLRKLAAGVRLGATGVNLGFGLITNPLRDIRDGVLKTLKAPPSYLVRTVRSAGPQTDVDRLFMAGGGEMATRVGVDIRQFRKLRREIAAQTKPEVVKMHLLHSIDWIRDVVAFTETYGRRGEFRAVYEDVLQKTGDKESAWIAAQAAASDVTTNFRRAGVYGRFLNQIIPFYNAAIQGTNNLTIAARRNPTKFAMTALASLTVPQLALWALHRDDEWYQELPIWEKALFTHLKIGNQVIRIPLPFEAGFVFATMPVAILDYYRNKDKKRFDDIMGTAFDSLLPPAAVPGIKEYYEWNANLNTLTGQPIESQRLESLLPEDRFYETTSEVYRKIGKMAGMSPVKIENTVVGLTGGLSRNFTDPFKARKVQEAADIPVLGRLFSRQNRTGQSVSDIYEESSAAEEAYASILKALDESKPERIAKLEEKYRDLIGFNADGPLEKGNTRERYPRLYLLRDARKLLKEAKGLDDPKMSTLIARIMLGRTKLEDLPVDVQENIREKFDLPDAVN